MEILSTGPKVTMGKKSTCAVFSMVLLSYYTYKMLSNKDVFILVQGSPHNFNASAIHMLPHTALVYKIKSSAYDHLDNRTTATQNNNNNNTDNNSNNKWNYAVVGRGFSDDIALRNYLQSLGRLDFIEDYNKVTTIGTKPNLLFDIYNFFLKSWGRVGAYFDIIPSRPFETLKNSTRECKSDAASYEEEVHAISLLKVLDAREMNRYRSFFMWTAFPAYNVHLVYTGKPDTGEWTTFVIFRYLQYKDFCELMTSQLYEEAVQHKYKSVGDSYGFMVQPL